MRGKKYDNMSVFLKDANKIRSIANLKGLSIVEVVSTMVLLYEQIEGEKGAI